MKEEMDYMTIIGLVAAALGGISLFPQLLKVLKTKSTKDVSLGMIIIFSSSIFLWLVYGILMENSPRLAFFPPTKGMSSLPSSSNHRIRLLFRSDCNTSTSNLY